MKTLRILLALATVCAAYSSSAQALKPLKSFKGNEIEYLEENFKEGNELFKSQYFEQLIKAIEANMHTIEIAYDINNYDWIKVKLYLENYGQAYNDKRQDSGSLTGLVITFEQGGELRKAVAEVHDAFHPGLSSVIKMPFNRNAINKLSSMLKKVKIERIFFEKKHWVRIDDSESW